METKKNSGPYKPVSPFEVGQARRANERAVLAWLNANEGQIVSGPNPVALPPGWYYEDCSIPPVHSSGGFPGIPGLKRFRLRRGTPPPPAPPPERVIGGASYTPWLRDIVIGVLTLAALVLAVIWGKRPEQQQPVGKPGQSVLPYETGRNR